MAHAYDPSIVRRAEKQRRRRRREIRITRHRTVTPPDVFLDDEEARAIAEAPLRYEARA